MSKLIYLASPYSHTDRHIRRQRYMLAKRHTIWLLKHNFAVFSPIVYGYYMDTEVGMNYEHWQTLNDTMVRACDILEVLPIDGWDTSRGVAHEIALAKRLRKTIRGIP